MKTEDVRGVRWIPFDRPEALNALRRAANVHGLTVTIFNDARKVYSRAFGVADLPGRKPLRTDTEIYGASLSKAVFSVLVMKLVEQGVIDAEKWSAAIESAVEESGRLVVDIAKLRESMATDKNGRD